MLRAGFCLTFLVAASATPLSAQLISIRTVPVSQAHQFQIFPSQTIGMGGVSIAVRDLDRDPFANPAMGARLGAARVFGSPAAYSVSDEAGGGRSLPFGALARTEDWFGGAWLTLQEVDMSEQPNFFGPPGFCPACESSGLDLSPAEQSKGNTYAFAMLGRTLGSGVSIGGSILWSGLNAVDGVDLLYAGSARIDQTGNAVDARLGLLKEWSDDRSLEMLLLHNRWRTSHDVWYLDQFWDPASQQFMQRPRFEQNLDRTNTWGLHVAYEQPLPGENWQIGGIATINRMDHPKIPNYEIMNIPRDPGHSSAFNIGVGVGRVDAESAFGVDFIYEPIWSHTWADAAEPIETSAGQTIPAGGMTIENHFRFSNALLRAGVSQDVVLGSAGPVAGLQLGLSVRRIHYWLEQENHIQLSSRDHEEAWVEWTPTWGVNLEFTRFDIRYTGSVTHGTGRPGIVQRGGFAVPQLDAAGGSNILAAPSGPLTLTEVRVVTHQVSLSLPIH